ncbi:putative T6SS immunity periplasmic lipoprotein [Klebsiella electrica]
MKRLVIFPLIILLSGCPGGKPGPSQRSIFIHGDTLCFSVNKNDALEHYNIYYYPKGNHTVIKSDKGINTSYPNTCFKFKLRNGYQYNIYYGLNGKQYTDSFFIDNDGRL